MSESEDQFIMAGDLSEDDSLDSWIKKEQTRKDIREEVGKRNKEAMENSVPFEEKIQDFVPKAKEYVQEYFRKLAVHESVQLTETIVRVDNPDPERHYGSAGVEMIEVNAHTSIELNALRRYIQAREMIHELYHNAAPYKFTHESVAERHGLQYNEEDGLLEEGLAITFELEAEEFLKSQFPKGAEFNSHVTNAYHEQGRNTIPQEHLRVVKFNKKEWNVSAVHIPEGLVETISFLTDTVPDFRRLAEDARINHNTLALAHSIDNVFGKGTFIKLSKAKYDEAPQILQSLKESIGKD